MGGARGAGGGLASLFIDFNSYFASVEQQLQPRLLGRPVAVVPVMSERTCCIAASYEAKARGVRTGTKVYDAIRLCPTIELVQSRPREYVKMHHRLVQAIESCIPVQTVHSIDEMACRLLGAERQRGNAVEIARRIKRAIGREFEHIRCSIGIAPNRFLAKVGTDMQKPDGLVVIEKSDLPHALHRLDLIDLPGIGPRMLKRLNRAGIHSVEELCALSEHGLCSIWKSVLGRYWFHWLRGEDVPDIPTHKSSIGHQHVLPPELRTEEGARAVAIKLLHKAAARMRHLGYWARQMTVFVDLREQGSWSAWRRLGGGAGVQDTLSLVRAFVPLWASRPPGEPLMVDVTLHNLVHDKYATLPLFPEERHERRLAEVMDAINRKFGRNSAYLACMHEARDAAPMGIAFSSVPDLDLPDAWGRAEAETDTPRLAGV